MDLHARFVDWLADGAEGEPPRDLALHASSCEDCMRSVAAVDSLRAIDVGAAPLPPLHRVAEDRARPIGVARVAVGGLAVILLGASVAIAASGFFRATPPADEPARSAEGVLAGAPSPDNTDRPVRDTPTPSPSASPAPSASPTVAASLEATAAPAAAPAPAPPQPAPGTAAPQPPRTAAPQPPAPTAAPATPAPTAPPPQPTPSIVVPPPTASPSPTPTLIPLAACSNGVDDDGDTFIDFGLIPGVNDPECSSPDDDDESA
jgi:hypothetical protein